MRRMDSTPVTHLLYLLGFRSSPKSTKARMETTQKHKHQPGVTWWCPQLPPAPKEAMRMVMEGISAWPRQSMGVIGSSLGGFYATCVAQAAGCRAVVLNPAVDPARDLAKYIGEQTSWHDPDERFFFEPRYVDELRTLDTGPIRDPEKFFAVLAKGDEVLDWREMVARYAGCRIELLEGSDHALSDFDEHINEVFQFKSLV